MPHTHSVKPNPVSVAGVLAVVLSGLALLLPAGAIAGEGCPNEARRAELNSTFLPECRAYEMVSPRDKNGGVIAANANQTMAAQELAPGEPMAAQFSSTDGFSGAVGTGILVQYVGVRDATPGTQGWTTHPITPRTEPTTFAAVATAESHYLDTMSPDLSQGIFRSFGALTEEDPNVSHVFNLYERTNLRSVPSEQASKLLTGCPGCTEPLSLQPVVLFNLPPFLEGISSDFGHILFSSRQHLTADTPECTAPRLGLIGFCPLYLFESDRGAVRLAGILPDGSVATVSNEGGFTIPMPHRLSDDGTRLIFDASEQVYQRIGNGTPSASTIQISASERTDCNIQRKEAEPGFQCTGAPEPDPNGTGSATYLDASPDGKRVLFTSTARLTDDSTGGDIYLYSAEAPEGHRLRALGATDGQVTGNPGLIGASEGLSYVYFSNVGQLVTGAPPITEVGTPAIFVWHDDGTASGTLKYIAGTRGGTPISPGGDMGNENGMGGGSLNVSRQSRVTPDGRHLLFATAFDPLTREPQDPTAPVDQLWLYDAEGETSRCVSCYPSGAPTPDQGFVLPSQVGRATPPEASSASNPSWPENHPINSEGRLVFFTTEAALVPQDVNGTLDAYAYDAATSTVHLLSSGQSDSNSFFMDASASGEDALIVTSQALVGWDGDESFDLYDVRVDGGLPNPPAAIPECEGESCQPQSSFATTTPASLSFSGEGNVAVKLPVTTRSRSHCHRGLVRRKVKGRTKCVRRHATTKRHGKRGSRRAARGGGR